MIRRTMVVAASLAVAALCACAVLVLAILFDGSMRHTATVLAAFEALALSQAMLHGEGVGPMLGIGLDALRKAVLALCFAPVALAALLGEAVQTASLVWYAGLSGGISAAIPTVFMRVVDGGGRADAGPAELPFVLALFVAGTVAGAVYWALSGRHVGAGHPVSP